MRVDDSVDQDELVLGAGASEDTEAWPDPIQLLLAHLKERETVVNGGRGRRGGEGGEGREKSE